jgi:tetratricopeptide (TPR) repeat protein
LGYTILGIYLWLGVLKESESKRLRYATLALVSTALISTIPWIYVNATEQKAVERLTHLLDLDGKRSALGHEELAYYYRNHGKKDKEIEEWKKTIALFEKRRYVVNLGVVYTEVGRYQEAAWVFEELLSKDPEDHQAHSELGKVYVAQGRYEEAKRQFQKAIEFKPDNPLYYENLGFLLLKLKSYKEAKEVFQKGVQIDPSYLSNYRNLGFVYFDSGENKEAMKYLELYLKYEPQAKDKSYVQGLINQLKAKEKEARP